MSGGSIVLKRKNEGCCHWLGVQKQDVNTQRILTDLWRGIFDGVDKSLHERK